MQILAYLAFALVAIGLAIAWQLKWFKYGFIKHRGVWMRGDFAQKLEADQKITTYRINGQDYLRIPYGHEKQEWGAEHQPCHDCGALKGELHATGCDVERCPVCGEQAITCDCHFDGIDK